MNLDKEQIKRLSKDELKAYLKTSNKVELSEAARSVIRKQKIDPKTVDAIKELLK